MTATKKTRETGAGVPCLILAAYVAFALSACGSAHDDAGFDQDGAASDDGAVASAKQPLYANRDFFWSGDPVIIPVCWENPGVVPAARRNWVRDAIESNWARYARVNFVEWGTCSTGQAGIHIEIADARSSAPGASISTVRTTASR